MIDCGIIYVATRLDRHVEEAFTSAESLRRHSPSLKITLFTDRPHNPLCRTRVFDAVEGIENAGAEGQLDRIICLARSPYQRTLYIDTDTRIYSDQVPALFALLDLHDLAMAEDPAEFSPAVKDSGRRMFNSGVILYARNQAVSDWRDRWETRVRRNLSFAHEKTLPEIPELAHVADEEKRRELLRTDQIALTALIGPEANRQPLRILTLDNRWNSRAGRPRSGVHIHHCDAYRNSTKPDILNIARDWTRTGSAASGAALYEYVAAAEPPHLTGGRTGGPREEWPTPDLMQADLHLAYGQFRQAAEILESAKGPSALVNAGKARVAMMEGKTAAAVALAAGARDRDPGSAYAALTLGRVLLIAGHARDAIAPLSFAQQERRVGAAFLAGQAWMAQADFANAEACFKQVQPAEREYEAAANNMMPLLLGQRRYGEALAQADRLLAAKPWQPAVMACKCLALSELGRNDERARYADAGLIVTEEIAVPPAYSSRQAFHVALAEAIKKEPSIAYEPAQKATRRGFQTGELAGSAAPAIRMLNAAAVAAADRRIARVRRDSGHAFDQAAPREYNLYSWAVVMHHGGHQAPHLHPGGWLSGVYYIDVPPEIAEDDPARAGWLEFGRGDARWQRESTVVPAVQVRPKPGLMVTFPSFFWHNTRPLAGNAARISFAFDIVPA